jgi:putative MATE family efflux protein
MKDLTKGSITGHLLTMSAFIGAGLISNTLYLLIDLYFVSRLGAAAIAGVSAAGVLSFLVIGASQMISIGAMALIAQAAGRKDSADATTVANQTFSLSLVSAALTLVLGYTIGLASIGTVTADAETAELARQYLITFLPSLALMFPNAALGTVLRGAGIVRPTMIMQTGTILLNALLAPMLIVGWGTGLHLGVWGAGLASTIAVIFGAAYMWWVFPRVQSFVKLEFAKMRPNYSQWWRIMAIGLPSAGEFILMFVNLSVVYWVIRHFGTEAQAGYGIGSRVMQSIFLPAMAISFAVAPVAGQNFGARQAQRVRETFRYAALISAGLMVVLTAFCHWRPDLLMAVFTDDVGAAEVGSKFLRIISWSFLASAVVFTCSGMFQAFGDTRPALIASATRIFTFAIPAVWMAGQPGMTLDDVWHLSVASVFLQALVSFALLSRQMRSKLGKTEAAPA